MRRTWAKTFSIGLIIAVGIGLYLLISSVWGMYHPLYEGILSPIAVNADGEVLFALAQNSRAQLYVADVHQQKLRKLLSAEKPINTVNPSVSSNGKVITFISYAKHLYQPPSTLYAMKEDGSLVRLSDGKTHITEAVLSPDGKTVYYLQSDFYGNYSPIASNRPHAFDLYSALVDGTGMKKMTNLNAYEISDLALSPDGKELYFHLFDKEHGIFAVPVDHPADMHPVTSGDDYEPQLSPDRKTLVYTSVPEASRFGTFEYELFSLDRKTGQAKQRTFLHSYATSPRFIDHGKNILFLQDTNWPSDPSHFRLMQMTSDGKDIREIGISPQR